MDACLAPLRAIKVVQAISASPYIDWRKLANTGEAACVRVDCSANIRRPCAVRVVRREGGLDIVGDGGIETHEPDFSRLTRIELRYNHRGLQEVKRDIGPRP